VVKSRLGKALSLLLKSRVLGLITDRLPETVREEIAHVIETIDNDTRYVTPFDHYEGDICNQKLAGINKLFGDVGEAGAVRAVNILNGAIAGGKVRACNLLLGDVESGQVGVTNVLKGAVRGGTVRGVNLLVGDVHGGHVRGVNVLVGDIHGGEVEAVNMIIGDVLGGTVKKTHLVIGKVDGGEVFGGVVFDPGRIGGEE